MKQYLPLAFLSIVFVLLLLFLNTRNSLNFVEDQKNIPTISKISSDILITSPSANTSISSPYKIVGKIKNNWMFEGSFSVIILDNNKQDISQSVCNEIIPGSWTTEGMIDFTCNINFQTNSSDGYLKFLADNPSGLPQNEKIFLIPTKFTTTKTTNSFCGGITGKACPTGYECVLDGQYPDAGGKCQKNNVVTTKYSCPVEELVDCEPPTTNKPKCNSEFIKWATENCPNFKGAAL